jgi:hypothetical protein
MRANQRIVDTSGHAIDVFSFGQISTNGIGSSGEEELALLDAEETPKHVTSLAAFDFPSWRNDAGEH